MFVAVTICCKKSFQIEGRTTLNRESGGFQHEQLMKLGNHDGATQIWIAGRMLNIYTKCCCGHSLYSTICSYYVIAATTYIRRHHMNRVFQNLCNTMRQVQKLLSDVDRDAHTKLACFVSSYPCSIR